MNHFAEQPVAMHFEHVTISDADAWFLELTPERRLLYLAHVLAEVHIGDGDVLGLTARALLVLIDARDPSIAELPAYPDDA